MTWGTFGHELISTYRVKQTKLKHLLMQGNVKSWAKKVKVITAHFIEQMLTKDA